MADRAQKPVTRPRPGPRPRPAAHGVNRRRVASRPTAAGPTRSPRGRAPQQAPQRQRARSSKKEVRTSEPVASKPPMDGATKARWVLIGLIIAAGACVVALLEAPVFAVSEVQISGSARTSDGAIEAMLDVSADQALLTYDMSAGTEGVASLPWVESVALSRQWPSTLRVVVRERTIASAVGHPAGKTWLVVAADGIVVEKRLTPPSGVPLIISTVEVVDAAVVGTELVGVDRAREIAHSMPLQLDPWITTWTSHDDGSVSAGLVGSARANFGAHADHRTQFVSLASILNGGADLVCLAVIDLSIADTPVLHRDPACIVASRQLS